MSRTRYKFIGYTITNCGYHQPDHCVWWEAVDENGEACFHGHSLREVEFMILDDEWEKKLREKDAEIERLKHSSVGNAATMREAQKPWIAFGEWLLGNAGKDRLVEALRENRPIIRHMIEELRGALAKPPHQCDVGTAEEQPKRFSDFCASHRHTDLPRCAGCPLENTPSDTGCSFAWAQMPYEAAEGGANA